MKKRVLEQALEAVPDFPQPDASREQYRTPAPVAADFLWDAWQEGDIDGKRVLDLGCGTGVLSLGAAMLGGIVTGVDSDAAALEVARGVVPTGTFIEADLASWEPIAADTVIMNPPFGAQKKSADRVFYERGAEAVRSQGGAMWFLGQPKTQRFLTAYADELGGTLERIRTWEYPIPARFWFHDREVATIPVAGYRMGFD